MSLGCVEKPLHDGSRDVAEYHGTHLAFKVWRRCQRALQCSSQERGFPPHRLEIISLCVLEDFDNSSCRIFALLLRVNQAFSVTTKWFSLWVITGWILAKVQMPSAMFAEHLHWQIRDRKSRWEHLMQEVKRLGRSVSRSNSFGVETHVVFAALR